MGINLNAIRQENQRLSSNNQNTSFLDNFVMMPEGEGSITIRILPPRKGLELPFCASRTHKLNQKNFHCLQTMVNGKWVGNCPICSYYKYLWRESDSVGEDQAKELQAEARMIKPVERYYYNVIVRKVTDKNGNVQNNVGPKIYSCGKQVHSKIIRAMCGDPSLDEEELGDVTDLAIGRDFKIIKKMTKSGNDAFPSYTESKFLGISTAGTEDEISEWLENLHDLEALRQTKSVDDLQKELRYFRGLEKDPNLEFDPTSFSKTTLEEAPVLTKKVTVADDDTDTALPDDEFISKLRSL